MVASGPPFRLPVARPRLAAARFESRAGGNGGFPYAPALEPHQHHIRLGALELRQRRQQILAILRAEGGRHCAVDDHPERMRLGH
jgi:hypothetical protein